MPSLKISQKFLNGVCRHERKAPLLSFDRHFLNGVCRHELFTSSNLP
ncbi:hypothetical protein J583_2152 [Acinetobacter baumannii 83444]|nr:hypothetical protein J583_2151 [Acinetobacter baumannii 83444]EXE77833.1 hypothetical protein J583_2152 [Acinetobacter baumannii 83444]